MDPPALTTQLDDLTAQIDDLSTALTPLLKSPLSTTASTLPLLDKAKLYIHVAYTIESLLFSSLLTAGENAKAHPVFAELARLKTYFQKLQEAEHGPAQPTTKLDKDAAGRFIRHGLSGNEKYDKERREKMEKERARAAEKARKMVNKRFDDGEESARQAALPKEERPNHIADDEDDDEESGEDENSEDAAMNDAYDQEAASAGSSQRQTRKKPGRKDEKGRPKSREEMKAERRDKKVKKRQGRSAEKGQAPKTPGEAFKALAEGQGRKGKGKK